MNMIGNILKRESGIQYLNNHQDLKIVCFGASKALRIVLDDLKSIQVAPDFICDSDEKKHGEHKNGYIVQSPDEVFGLNYKFFVIISSMYAPEIKRQLLQYKNIVFYEDYRYCLPANIVKTELMPDCDTKFITIKSDIPVQILPLHVSRLQECKYLNYLSYCNHIIADDKKEDTLYLDKSMYNFTETNFKKILKYFIFKRYETASTKPIVIESIEEFRQGSFSAVLNDAFESLSLGKFNFIKTTQSLKKRKAHALIWHLYHIDMFEEINHEMQDCAELFDIYISINPECTIDDIKRVLSVYPSANMFMFENRGRDVLPFLKIFQKIEKLGYDSLCKIHTKKSIHRDDGLDWGKALRTRLFDNKNKILSGFKSDGSIGAYVAKGNLGGFESVGLNRSNIEYACKLLDVVYTDDFSFPIGTMFWCKPKVLYQLALKKLHSKYFIIENGEIDGTFAHAIERLAGLLIRHNGYRLLEI